MEDNDVRDAETTDFGHILTLNGAEEMQTSPMTIATLRCLKALSSYQKVNDKVAVFLLAVREGATYENLNHCWLADAIYSEGFSYRDNNSNNLSTNTSCG
jgi:predicted GNAT superfamily acetyltransferase